MTIQQILEWVGEHPWLVFGSFVGTAMLVANIGNLLASVILAFKGKSNMRRLPINRNNNTAKVVPIEKK